MPPAWALKTVMAYTICFCLALLHSRRPVEQRSLAPSESIACLLKLPFNGHHIKNNGNVVIAQSFNQLVDSKYSFLLPFLSKIVNYNMNCSYCNGSWQVWPTTVVTLGGNPGRWNYFEKLL